MSVIVREVLLKEVNATSQSNCGGQGERAVLRPEERNEES